MSLAVYIKKPPTYIKPPKVQKPVNPARKRSRDKFFFLFISTVGLASIIFSLWPYFSWQLTTAAKLTAKIDEFPIPKGEVLSQASTLSANVQIVQDPDGFSYFTTNYKPPDPTQEGQSSRPREFEITIPKLKIKNAHVLVDSLKFDKNLAHFPGTPIPGEVGNSFVTGHSVLPQFADSENYRAIFTELSDLEIGDDVYVDVNGQKLHFAVQYSKIIDRRDLSVLTPISQAGRNLTLMTCVPPGTNLKRLVVITSLI